MAAKLSGMGLRLPRSLSAPEEEKYSEYDENLVNYDVCMLHYGVICTLLVCKYGVIILILWCHYGVIISMVSLWCNPPDPR